MGEISTATGSQHVQIRASTRRWALVVLPVLAVLLLAVLGGLAWVQHNGWTLDKPAVLGISPGDGTHNVAGNAPLAISFSEPMNPDSTVGNIKISPPTDGKFGWQGNTLIFTPTVGYQRDVTYTVSVEAGASTPLFQTLAATSSVSFKTAGLPSVYRSVPLPDTEDVPTDTMVTVEFSQPMVPLTAMSERQIVNSPDQITITPLPQGQWEWLGSTTLAFRGSPLAPATHYSVNISKNLTDIAGGQLDRDYNFAFDTIRPGVVSTSPQNGDLYVSPHAPIVVQFNQPVDQQSAESGLTIRGKAGGPFAWSPDGTVMTMTQSADMDRDTDYPLILQGVKPAPNSGAGDLAMSQPYTWTFHTSPVAQVANTTPDNGATGIKGSDQISVHFSAPISLTVDDPTQDVQIAPEVRGTAAYFYNNNTDLSIYAQLAPSTQYTITVGANGKFRDADGVTVPAYSWSFTTAPLAPSAYAINNNHLVSFYAGAPTRAFIQAVNVDFVRLRVWRLTGDELSSYMQLDSDHQAQYQPKGDLLRQWDLPVEQVLNKQQSLYPNIALDAQADRLPPGFYFLRVTSPQTIDGTALIVGNTALTMKQSNSDVLVWAADMGSGQPVAGRQVRLIYQGQQIGAATTGQDGIARISGDFSNVYAPVALTDDGGDAGLVSGQWSDGIAPWNFNLNTSGNSSGLNAAIYTDQPIYRPGETVHFKGIMRQDSDGSYSIPQPAQAGVILNNGTGQQVYSATLQLTDYGTFAGEYTLPSYAALGQYYISLAQNNQYFGGSFQVQEYRKPEYLVNVSTDKQDYVNGEQISATAGATYFFGGPVAGAQVTTRVNTQDYFFNWTDPDTGAYYDFQDQYAFNQNYSGFNGAQKSEATLTSDASGTVAFTVPADTDNRPVSQLLTIEAAVQDSSNQEVANSTQVIVHVGQYYIGLRPDSYVNAAGTPVSVTVQTVGIDKQKYGAASLTLNYYKRTWQQTTEKDENGLDRPTWQPTDTLLSSQNVTTDGTGAAAGSFTPSEPGEYRVAAMGRDSLGNTINSATYVYVTSADADQTASWDQANAYAINMVADKQEYKPGDTARILVTSPFKQATALLTIERGSILSYQIVNLSGSTPVIEVPIGANYLPNVYLSLSVIAPDGGDGGQPAFRQGWLGLNVSAAQKQLQVSITPSSDKVAPGDTVTYTISTRDATGNPVPAEVSVAVVDKALYSLAPDNSTALMAQFYGHRGLAYSIASSMLALQDQINPNASGAGGKGGGGGGDAGTAIRTQFSDLAYWKADVTTDDNGNATLAIPLPDNLTTWRLTARAVTKDTLVGEANNEIVATKPLLLQTVLPRFALSGDQFQAGAIVHNYTSATLKVDVSLAISGATALDSTQMTQTVTLPAGGQTTADFGVQVGSGSAASFTYKAQAEGDNGPADGVAITVPVQPSLVPEVEATAGEVDANSTQQEQVLVPQNADTRFGELKVEVSPSLAAGTVGSLEYLEANDWESTETTVSRFLPLLQLNQAYKAALLATPYSGKLDDIVNGGLQQLYAGQQYDGGWSWWSSGPTDPWMTAYALEGLSAARAAGYAVTDDSISRAGDYLTNWLNGKRERRHAKRQAAARRGDAGRHRAAEHAGLRSLRPQRHGQGRRGPVAGAGDAQQQHGALWSSIPGPGLPAVRRKRRRGRPCSSR